MHLPVLSAVGEGGEPPTKFSKRRGLAGSQFHEGGVAGNKEGDFFFRGDAVFT